MENDGKGSARAGSDPAGKGTLTEKEAATLRTEFEVMQRLDFTFIRELGASTAEEYVVKVTELRFSAKR